MYKHLLFKQFYSPFEQDLLPFEKDSYFSSIEENFDDILEEDLEN